MIYHFQKAFKTSASASLYLVVGGLLSTTALSATFLSTARVSAEDSVINDVSITVPIACTMSGTGMNSHTATVPNGTYEDDIGTTTLKAFCNDSNGFAIYAIGFTGEEYTGTNHTRLVGVNDSTKTIATGTATSGNTSNWAMKLETSGSATYPITLTNGYGSYSNVPDTYTKVAQRTSATDVGTNATGSTLTTTYAAYMASTQAADTYAGKVKYTLVHPYDEPAPEIVYIMQNLDPSNCVTNKTTTVKDIRDNEEYLVQRLADGKCWMLDNLRLDPRAVSLTTLQGNTNASNTTLNYFKNGGGTTSDKYAINGLVGWQDSYSQPSIYVSSTTITAHGAGSGKVGVYYNYCAASAGSFCYGDGSSSGTSSGNATEDICPAGWRMPTGGSSGEYNALYVAYSSNASSFKAALSTLLSGTYAIRETEVNTSGFWWASTRNDDEKMYRLNLYGDNVYTNSSIVRRNGLTIRCLLAN